MKLTIIGSQGAYPAPGKPSSGYLLQHDGFSLMLDFGSGILMHLPEYLDINRLDAVYLSHYHHDHVADIGVLQHAVKVQTDLGNRTSILPIFGQSGKNFFDSLSYRSYTEASAIGISEGMTIGPFSCRFLKNPHPDDSLSLSISAGGKTIVYTGDTGWNDELISFAASCDMLLCEASLFNCFKGRVEGHLTAGEAGLLAQSAEAGRLVLTHFPHFGVPEDLKTEAAAEFTGRINLAIPGDVYDLTVN